MKDAPVMPSPDLQDPVYDSIDARWRPVARNLASLGRLNPVGGNTVKIYTEGLSKFADFNEDLRNAERYIDLEYYRFASDSIACAVKDILLDKAGDGVPVRMIMESRTTWPKRPFYRSLKDVKGFQAADVQSPGDILGSIVNLDFRDHRKIALVDGRICYTGGMNITEVYHKNWRDTHLKLEGPVVDDFQKIFDGSWKYFSGGETPVRPCRDTVPAEGAIMQAVSDGPDSAGRPIQEGFEQALATAEDYFWAQTPYLCPPRSTLKALKSAAGRGVDVRLMLPKSQDVQLMLFVNHAFYRRLLRSGVRLYERDDPFMHSKSYIADGYLSCYGTANIDNRSFKLNFEDNVYIYDEAVALRGRKIFLDDLKHSRELSLEDLRWSLWERIMQGIVILFGYTQW